MRGACSVQVRMEYDIHGTVLRSVLKKNGFFSILILGPVRNPPSTGPKESKKHMQIICRVPPSASPKKMHSPVKRLDSFPTSCHEKNSAFCSKRDLLPACTDSFQFGVWTCEEPTVNRPKPHRHRQAHKKMHSPVKRQDSFPTSCHKKIQHSVPNVIC